MSTFIQEFLDLLPHSVTHEPRTGRDAYGKPSYGASAAYPKCRVTYRQQRVSSARAESLGHDVVAAGAILFGDVLTVTVDDRFTLPDGNQPPIINWETIPDEFGAVYTKVFFGSV